jgi:hypothetical protein
VLKPGGVCLVKEPITTMGDWRTPRKGLTPCERGFPRALLGQMIAKAGFGIVRKSYFEFPPLRLMLRDRAGIDTYNSKLLTGLDQLCCKLTDWNYRYYRPGWFQKLAPSYTFLVLQKPK